MLNPRGSGGCFAPTAPTWHNAGVFGCSCAEFQGRVYPQSNLLHAASGGTVWQRNNWDHIIRDEQEFNATSAYIRVNPAHWNADKLSIPEG